MIYLFLSILVFNKVFCYTIIPETFDNQNVLEGYITPEDNLLIFSYNISGKMALYKYEKLSTSNTYPKGYELKLEPFPENSSDIIKDDFYSHIKQTAPTTIEFSIFNEKYLSSYTYNESLDYSLVSMEKIGLNQFVFFYISNSTLLNNTIRIASFDFKKKAFNFKKSYNINNINGTANCYCTRTNNNNIICGLIEVNLVSPNRDNINYYLILLQEEIPIQKIRILNYSPLHRESYVNGLFEANFIKFVPLENEKIIYCLNKLFTDSGDILCGLFQIKDNSNIEILISNEQIFNSFPKSKYARRNLFSAINFNNNEIILAFTGLGYFYKIITRLTVSNNNNFITKEKRLNHTISSNRFLPDFIQVLKNKDNDIIFLIIDKGIAKFHEFGYSICNNTIRDYLYNGREYQLNFIYEAGLFKGHNYDIVFTGNINSIVYGAKKKRVEYGVIYNSSEIYYKLSLKDVDSINKNWQYNITFRNTLNEKESETCIHTLNFNPCDEGCDICGDGCYDKKWNKVDRNKKRTKAFITNVSILIFLTIFSIIILLLVGFLRAIKFNQNLNQNANLNIGNMQNENLVEG